MPRVGLATIPLDYGKCPKWLFERMKKLARSIVLVLREEFGPEEILKRLSDPVWFQSFGCVLAFDWNSSGLTTTTLGALKTALFDIQDRLGIYVCGGKGKTSRKTPEEITAYGISRGFSFSKDLIYASKMAAKVDSNLIQTGHQIYHHSFLFTKSGEWCVIQQGLNTENKTARRYHWLSSNMSPKQSEGRVKMRTQSSSPASPERSEGRVKMRTQSSSPLVDFVEEPHRGIIAGEKTEPLNLTAKKSRENKRVSTGLVKEEPKTFLRDIQRISEKPSELVRQKRLPGFTELELNDVEFFWHPVVNEKFNLKRLKKTIEKAHFLAPKNFEELLATEGVGPRTIRALSLVSELIYGAKPSYEDPARYSFSHGGKDGTPYMPSPSEMDKTIKILEKGIQRAQISIREKAAAEKRLCASPLFT